MKVFHYNNMISCGKVFGGQTVYHMSQIYLSLQERALKARIHTFLHLRRFPRVKRSIYTWGLEVFQRELNIGTYKGLDFGEKIYKNPLIYCKFHVSIIKVRLQCMRLVLLNLNPFRRLWCGVCVGGSLGSTMASSTKVSGLCCEWLFKLMGSCTSICAPPVFPVQAP